jgi:HK97 family phage major capsid protein
MSEKFVQMIEEIGTTFADFRVKNDAKLKKMEDTQNVFETYLARQGFRGGLSSRGDGIITSEAEKEHAKAFFSMMRKGDIGNLRDLEIRADLSTLSDPEGGWLCPVEIEKQIERLALSSLAMRRLATVKRSATEYKKPLSTGISGTGGGWMTEKGTRDETGTPDLRLFEPPFCEAYSLPKVTQKLLDLSDFDIEGWLVSEINDVLVQLEGESFISGNGVGRPMGIASYETIADASWTYGNKVGYIASGHASLLNNVDKIRALKHALPAAYRQSAVFLMNDSTQEAIANFKDGEGRYIWKEGLTENAPDTLLGRPVEIDDNVDDIGAGKFPIFFGDWKRAFTIIDWAGGMRLIRDNVTQKGWVLFYLVKRVAGGISNFQALKALKISET